MRVSPTGDQPLVVIFRDEDGPRAAIVARTLWTRLRFHLGYWKVRLLRVRILHIVHGGLISDGTPQAQQAILEHLRGLLQTRQVHAISVNHMPVNHEPARGPAGGWGSRGCG